MNNLFAVALLFIVAWIYLFHIRDLTRRTRDLEQLLYAIAKKVDVPLPLVPPAPSQRILDMARDPKHRIEAIRAYRQETGVGLKVAVEAIDRHQDPGSPA